MGFRQRRGDVYDARSMKTSLHAITVGCVLFCVASALGQPQPIALEHVRVVALDPGHGGENSGAMGFHGVLEKHLTLEIARKAAAAIETHTTARVILTRLGDETVHFPARGEVAALYGADLMLSLHTNAAANPDASGVETFFLSTEAQQTRLAADPAAPSGRQHTHGDHGWESGGQDKEFTPADGGAASAEPGGQPADRAAVVLEAMRRAALHPLSERLASVVQTALTSGLGAVDRGVKQANFAVLRESPVPAVVVELGFLTHPREGTTLLLDAYQEQIAMALVDAVVAWDSAVAAPAVAQGAPAKAKVPRATPAPAPGSQARASSGATPRMPGHGGSAQTFALP
jgi:N-acetylmuramoyl-L-alanine amidase